MRGLLIISALFLTYGVASDIIFLGLRRFLRQTHVVSPQELFFLTRGCGPLIISWLLYNLFLFTPHRAPWFYIVVIGAVFALIVVLSRQEFPVLFHTYTEFVRALRRLLGGASLSLLLFASITLICSFILVIGIGFPIVGHDSLIFAMDARVMRQDVSLEHYLSSTVPDPVSGYLPIAFGAPFLQMLYVWFSFLAGVGHMDLLARTVSPLFGIHCLLLLGYFVRRHSGSIQAALWATFLLGITPLFLFVAYDNAQDTPRYYFVFVSVVWFAKALEAAPNTRLRLVGIAGVFSGFAVYSHLLGAPLLAVGSLAVVLSGRHPFRRRAAEGALILITAAVMSASYHYLVSTPIRAKLPSIFSWHFLDEWTSGASSVKEHMRALTGWTQKPHVTRLPLDLETTPAWRSEAMPPLAPSQVISPLAQTDQAAKLSRQILAEATLKARGQGSSPLQQFLFGRLQMFTGVEYFGVLFFLFWAAVLFWIRKGSQRTIFETLVLAVVLLYCVLVLSGVRRLSWSNPRYIGTLIIFGAYFAGPLLAQMMNAFSQRDGRIRPLMGLMLVAVLSFPTVLATSIRGAKVGLTNPGTFYADFRSLQWLDFLRTDPTSATTDFFGHFFGIQKTFRYALADEKEKLKHSHDYLALIQYFNEHAPHDACALVLREGRYFYYAQRQGVAHRDRRLWGGQRFANEEAVLNLFHTVGITHILVDRSLQQKGYLTFTRHHLREIMANPDLSKVEYQFGSAQLYRLRFIGQNGHDPAAEEKEGVGTGDS